MLAHTRELAFLQPKFTGPLKPTVAVCSTGATLGGSWDYTPGFYFWEIIFLENIPGFYFCLYFNGSEISFQSTSAQKNKQSVSQLGKKRGFSRNCLNCLENSDEYWGSWSQLRPPGGLLTNI